MASHPESWESWPEKLPQSWPRSTGHHRRQERCWETGERPLWRRCLRRESTTTLPTAGPAPSPPSPANCRPGSLTTVPCQLQAWLHHHRPLPTAGPAPSPPSPANCRRGSITTVPCQLQARLHHHRPLPTAGAAPSPPSPANCRPGSLTTVPCQLQAQLPHHHPLQATGAVSLSQKVAHKSGMCSQNQTPQLFITG